MTAMSRRQLQPTSQEQDGGTARPRLRNGRRIMMTTGESSPVSGRRPSKHGVGSNSRLHYDPVTGRKLPKQKK